VFNEAGFKTHPFGQFLDLYGVDFVHCPLSIMGKELGGENVERNVANKTGRSLVFGHTHRANVLNISKIGQARSIQVVNLGTSLPHGTIEKYAKMSQTGWTYGVFLANTGRSDIISQDVRHARARRALRMSNFDGHYHYVPLWAIEQWKAIGWDIVAPTSVYSVMMKWLGGGEPVMGPK
jgi:hypothetical protein